MRFLQINWSAEPPQFSRRSFFIRVLVGHIAFLLCWFGYWQIEENNWLQRWPEGVGAAFLGMIIALTWEHRRNRRKSHASIQSQAIQTPEIRKNAWNALAKITPAVIRCRICAQPLTRPLSYLSDSSLLNTTDNEPFIPSGFYAASDAKLVEVTDDQLVVNLDDVINTKNHPDSSRLHGCCGLHGCDGINTVCINGHEVGTERSDCWLPHGLWLEPAAVEIVEGPIP